MMPALLFYEKKEVVNDLGANQPGWLVLVGFGPCLGDFAVYKQRLSFFRTVVGQLIPSLIASFLLAEKHTIASGISDGFSTNRYCSNHGFE